MGFKTMANHSELSNQRIHGISDDQLEHGFISAEALPWQDLQYMVGNAKNDVLSDLLSLYLKKEVVLDNSEAVVEGNADCTGPAYQSKRGTYHTCLIQLYHLAKQEAGADTIKAQ